MVREARKLWVWQIVVSILEMDQNWNLLDPRRAAHILKTIVEIFLLSGVSNTLTFKVHDVLH